MFRPRCGLRCSGVVHFVILYPHVVRYVVRSSSCFEPAASCKRLLHGYRVGLLVADQHSLWAFPASERTEILERGVLQFRRKLPPQTVPATPEFGRQLGQCLPPLPPVPEQVPRDWLSRARRCREEPLADYCLRPPRRPDLLPRVQPAAHFSRSQRFRLGLSGLRFHLSAFRHARSQRGCGERSRHGCGPPRRQAVRLHGE
jgi:hypothetical protein